MMFNIDVGYYYVLILLYNKCQHFTLSTQSKQCWCTWYFVGAVETHYKPLSTISCSM